MTTFFMWQNGLCISYLLQFNRIKSFLQANGWHCTDTLEDADVAVLGACASWLSFYETFRDQVGSVRAAGDTEPRRLVVYGCLPRVDPAFYRQLQVADALTIPARHPERIEGLVSPLLHRWDEMPEESEFRREDYSSYQPGRIFVMIQEGCSEGCTYCPHTLGIGREASRPVPGILAQIDRGVENGASVVYIEGNNAGSWGLDLEPPATFADLMAAVCALPRPFSIRLGNFAPKWALRYGEVLMHPRVGEAKIPIQTTSDRLLTLVGRDPGVTRLSATLKEARRRNPGLVLRTEIIAGLPTETDAEFDDTLAFVAEHFDKVAVYSFDPHPATSIMRMGLTFTPPAVIEERLHRARTFFSQHPHLAAAFDFGAVCERIKTQEATATASVPA